MREEVDQNEETANDPVDDKKGLGDIISKNRRASIVTVLVGVTAAAAVVAVAINHDGDSPEDALGDYVSTMSDITSGGDGNATDIARGNMIDYVDTVKETDGSYTGLKFKSPMIGVVDSHVDSEYIAGKKPSYNDGNHDDSIGGESDRVRHLDGFDKVEGSKSVVALRGQGTFIGAKNGETADQPFVALVSQIDGDGWRVESVLPYSQIDGDNE